MAQRGMRFGLVSASLFWSSIVMAQTTAGLSTTVVFPVSAQTGSFIGEITLYNPGPNTLTASVSFYEGNNSGTPGPKVCNDVVVSANRSAQITLGTQCGLAAGGHFGLLVVADKAVPQSNAFYGYMRVQTPQGQGFSVEGFPITNFNNQVSHSIGLKRQAAAPTFQTNCFVGSLNQAVSYELRLFNGATGAQIGGTLSGSLQPFQQFRYLDVFGVNGVNAPAGDHSNVRAQFTPTSGGSANLIGFCTVQDNASLGADFRIAKSFGSPSGSFFVQGGNAFGTTAKLGTLDNQPLEIYANNQRVMRYQPNATSPNVTGGHPNNGVAAGEFGQTIGGGGSVGANCFETSTLTNTRICGNRTTERFTTIAGGEANVASAVYAVVGGGAENTASDNFSTIGGGLGNTASGIVATIGGGQRNVTTGNFSTIPGGEFNTIDENYATIAGGSHNTATGAFSTIAGGVRNVATGVSSFAAGNFANANGDNCAVFSLWPGEPGMHCFGVPSQFNIGALHGMSIDYFSQRGDGGGNRFIYIGDRFPPFTILAWNGAVLTDAGVWANASDVHKKDAFDELDKRALLDRLAKLPIRSWRYQVESEGIRHIGPTAQDFMAAFGLGDDDKRIGTVDADGVALAAIQGLHQLVQEKNAKIDAQARELEKLHDRLSRIEALLSRSAAR